MTVGGVEDRHAVAGQRVMHVQPVAVLVTGLGHERHRTTLLERDLTQYLLEADHVVARRQRISRIEVEFELAGPGLVMPALDRNPEAIEPLQHHVEELQLLT